MLKTKLVIPITFELDLRLATLCMLRTVAGNFGCHFGLKCSSLCKMNIGTSCRSACTALGYEIYPSVIVANMLIERMGWFGCAVDNVDSY